MKIITQCITLVLLVFVTYSLAETIDSSVEEITRSNSEFAIALYSELAKTDVSSNIFFSPLSIHAILALAYVGAGGKTAQEMAAGLHLPANVEVVKSGFQQLLQGMANNTEGAALEIANKIYLAIDSHVKDNFSKAAVENFLSTVQNVDFSAGVETAKIINEWVANKTHNKIQDIVSKDGLDSLTKSLLVNAVYFKGTWETSFEKSKTSSRPFYITPNKTKTVEMMNVYSEFVRNVNKDIGADILELPYAGKTMSLVVILPLEVDGLSDVENKLRVTDLKTLLPSIRKPQSFHVHLPRFKLEESVELDGYLKALGMSNMFEKDADFSAMSNSSSYISKVLHKAFIEVNEEGTEASAATVVQYSARMINLNPPKFNANHPFVFILRSQITGTILFMGRVTNPQ